LVLVGQPGRLARQVDGSIVQAQRWDQLLGVVPDDYFRPVNDGDGSGQDTPGFQVLAGGLVGQQVVVFILNTVGRQKFFQRPAAESTRVGVNVDFPSGGRHRNFS